MIFLAKGVQLKGKVKGYDQFTIILEDTEGRVQMVYKHSVTTVSPSRPVSELPARPTSTQGLERGKGR